MAGSGGVLKFILTEKDLQIFLGIIKFYILSSQLYNQ